MKKDSSEIQRLIDELDRDLLREYDADTSDPKYDAEAWRTRASELFFAMEALGEAMTMSETQIREEIPKAREKEKEDRTRWKARKEAMQWCLS